jgi:hypothetical protein
MANGFVFQSAVIRGIFINLGREKGMNFINFRQMQIIHMPFGFVGVGTIGSFCFCLLSRFLVPNWSLQMSHDTFVDLM